MLLPLCVTVEPIRGNPQGGAGERDPSSSHKSVQPATNENRPSGTPLDPQFLDHLDHPSQANPALLSSGFLAGLDRLAINSGSKG